MSERSAHIDVVAFVQELHTAHSLARILLFDDENRDAQITVPLEKLRTVKKVNEDVSLLLLGDVRRSSDGLEFRECSYIAVLSKQNGLVKILVALAENQSDICAKKKIININFHQHSHFQYIHLNRNIEAGRPPGWY
jgi:hypothetical protein